jgi:hypothetical protein
MKQMLKDAQRILDECSEDHVHPANNRRHPFHQQALKAIAELEEKIIELTDRDRPTKKGKKMKLKNDNFILHEDDPTYLT